MTRIMILLVVISCWLLIHPFYASATEYEVGTSFTVEINVDLDGETGDYIGYDETEYEVRKYEIIGIEGDVVNWRYRRQFEFDSNEGESFTQDDVLFVSSDKNNRSYIENENDPDAAYYTFDNIWWRIHPDEVNIGDTVRILGADYTYRGIHAVRLSATTAVNAMKFETTNYRYQVNDPEYDPDGFIDLTVDETFFFDIDTGYILKSNWNAYVETSVGDFSWEEEIVLTDSTFPVINDWGAFVEVNGIFILLMVLLFGGITMGIVLVRKSWQEDVLYAIDLMKGKITLPPRTPSLVPTTWNPLDIGYKMLETTEESTQKLMLRDGIYIVIETEDRLVIADTNSEQYMGNLIVTQSPDHLRMFYRLALGRIPPGQHEAHFITQSIPEIVDYTTTASTEAFGFVDQTALHLYQMRSQGEYPEYEEVAVLLARRKVLDYSHGQAPLSPSSHLRKVDTILSYKPHEIFLVGDDDLISITLARRGVQVTLVEIDPYTLALIDGIRSHENLPITISQVDLRDPLPKEYRGKYDLFVGDPDFTIQSFALFLSRGLSSLKHDGVGLINFENSYKQRYKAKFLLDKLGIDVIDEIAEPWDYTVIRNEKVPIRGYRYGKYTVIDYADNLVLGEANFKSRMFVIRKDLQGKEVLSPDQPLRGPEDSIYDY